MKLHDVGDLLLLAAIWGGSFLLTRMSVHDFGPLPLIELRVAIGGVTLLPLLAMHGGGAQLQSNARPLFVVGVLNSALPFALLAYALLWMTAGFASILNATSPLFGALIGWLWLKDRLSQWRVVGLIVGMLGVVLLVGNKAALTVAGSLSAVVAGLGATCLYGIAANYTKRTLAGVAPLAVAAGSQLSAALFLLIPAIWLWPPGQPPVAAWLAAVALGVAGSGLGYLLYFRLIANVGPVNAIAVTFLIPVFAMACGVAVLNEPVTPGMLGGGAVILLGTALTTGVLDLSVWRRRLASAATRKAGLDHQGRHSR